MMKTGENSVLSSILTRELESIRTSYKLPAMAGFVLRDGATVEQTVVGTRSVDDDTPVCSAPQWHLGSNAKAMTAMLAGLLVEEGVLRWDMTLGEVIRDAAPKMDAAHSETTLAMLLYHTGGIVANINWIAAPEDRVACAAQILASPPARKRGKFLYSNAGYTVAGAMMEICTGERWEALLQKRLFGKLAMNQSGFGAPEEPGSPWGHSRGWFRWLPKDPSDGQADNPAVLGPAGTVHATLDDYARFLAAHLAGARGEEAIITAKTFSALHTPPAKGHYAMGWLIAKRGWAGGRVLAHSGSNTMWYATTWLAPEKNMAFFAVTNAGGAKAGRAVDKAIGAMIKRHNTPGKRV